MRLKSQARSHNHRTHLRAGRPRSQYLKTAAERRTLNITKRAGRDRSSVAPRPLLSADDVLGDRRLGLRPLRDGGDDAHRAVLQYQPGRVARLYLARQDGVGQGVVDVVLDGPA